MKHKFFIFFSVLLSLSIFFSLFLIPSSADSLLPETLYTYTFESNSSSVCPSGSIYCYYLSDGGFTTISSTPATVVFDGSQSVVRYKRSFFWTTASEPIVLRCTLPSITTPSGLVVYGTVYQQISSGSILDGISSSLTWTGQVFSLITNNSAIFPVVGLAVAFSCIGFGISKIIILLKRRF